MIDLNKFIKESKEDTSSYTNPIEGVNWENPNDEGCKIIEKWLKDNNLMPNGRVFDNKYMKSQNWKVMIFRSDDTRFYSLGYDCVIQRPFKKRLETTNRILEFYEKCLMAASKGGIVLYPNENKIEYSIIEPIAKKLGMKYNKEGEFLVPGEKSGWD